MLMKLAPKRPRSLRKFYLSIGATLVIMVVGRYFALKAEEQRAKQQSQWIEQVLQVNSTLPRQIDAVTQLERVEFVWGDTFLYVYRVGLSAKLPWERRAKMQERAGQQLEQLACKEPKMLEAMHRFKLRQKHLYVGDEGGELFHVELLPDKLACAN